MSPEQLQFLEEQYSDFEREHLPHQRFWRAPVWAVTNTPLFPVFQRFQTLFPDHPDEHNTLFYILEGPRDGGYTALLVCRHFEHCALDDVRELADFLDEAGRVVEHNTCILLDYLGGETLIARFSEASDKIVSLIQSHATRCPT